MATTNDFIGSFAQENVSFSTQLIRTAVVGDNYWKMMVFVENNRFLNDVGEWTEIPNSAFEVTAAIPGNPGDDGTPGTGDNNETADTPAVMSAKGAEFMVVDADNYTTYAKGLLNSWLYDLFCNGFLGDCIIVRLPAEATDKAKIIAAMTAAYNQMKAYAYHKTVCAGADDVDNDDFAEICMELAKLCAADRHLLSAAPYFPFYTATPVVPDSCKIYKKCMDAEADAFMACYADKTRNAAMYSLGTTMAIVNNGSGTCVGSSIDMTKTTLIQCSGVGGAQLSKDIRDVLEKRFVQTFKPVGDNSGSVAAVGTQTILGEIMQADWIISYITYMTKVGIARAITVPDYLKTPSNYDNLVSIMAGYLSLFGPNGSGRLGGLVITAPAFANLPPAAGNEIIIPDAWIADYTDHVRTVKITGAMRIGV